MHRSIRPSRPRSKLARETGSASQVFTDKHAGVIFKLNVRNGKIIQAYSYFPNEDEVLIYRRRRASVVSSALYVGDDGYKRRLSRAAGDSLYLVTGFR